MKRYTFNLLSNDMQESLLDIVITSLSIDQAKEEFYNIAQESGYGEDYSATHFRLAKIEKLSLPRKVNQSRPLFVDEERPIERTFAFTPEGKPLRYDLRKFGTLIHHILPSLAKNGEERIRAVLCVFAHSEVTARREWEYIAIEVVTKASFHIVARGPDLEAVCRALEVSLQDEDFA